MRSDFGVRSQRSQRRSSVERTCDSVPLTAHKFLSIDKINKIVNARRKTKENRTRAQLSLKRRAKCAKLFHVRAWPEQSEMRIKNNAQAVVETNSSPGVELNLC